MAGSPPKPPHPTFAAAGSSSPKPPPPTFYHPSYGQLVDSYLRPRVVSDTKVGFIVHEADFYSADPYQLTENHLPATARSGERAWYFFTPLRPKGSTKTQMKRDVGSGRKGTWISVGVVSDVLSNGQWIGKRRGFAFHETVGGDLVKSAWRMMKLRLDPNQGGQEEDSSDLLALCKVYRIRIRILNAKAEDEISMAVAKADAEAPAASAVVTPGPKRADEEIGAVTAAGPGRKRKAGDKDSGAETVASSPGRQKKADGESADAATTGEIFADSKTRLTLRRKQNRRSPEFPGTADFFRDSQQCPLDAPEEAEQQPRDPRDRPHQFQDFFSGSQNPKKQ